MHSYNMHQKLQKGCLVRWVVDYKYYAAPATSGGIIPQEPIYNYGIVMEVSESDPYAVVIFCFDNDGWTILNMIHDEFEILNGGEKYHEES